MSRSSPDRTVSPDFLERLGRIPGPGCLLTARAELEAYARDNTGLRHLPEAVVLAEKREQVSAVLALCHDAGVPVTPRGAGTGNVGGALPVHGGVLLSTQRMKRILEISTADRLAVVEPGVVNADLQEQLAPLGLFWPPDPSSARSCTIGGNIAMCAAGPGAVRHGVTRDWVLGLEAVLADGAVFRTGGRTTKGVVGFDLTRLLIGSEGTLAVVTQATLKLAPRPAASRLLRAVFADVETAAEAVSALMILDTPPAAVEFLDAAALDLLRSEAVVALPEAGRAMLLLEVQGGEDEVAGLGDRLVAAMERFAPLELVRARNAEEASRVWAARAALSPCLKKLAPRRINEDVVVPVSRLAGLITGLAELSASFDIPIVNFGHAGNGNIHVNLLVDPENAAVMKRVEPLLERIFRLVLDLEGSLSGEHGVGIQKKPYVPWELDPVSLRLQREIKALFDPRGILNPGKMFPGEPQRRSPL